MLAAWASSSSQPAEYIQLQELTRSSSSSLLDSTTALQALSHAAITNATELDYHEGEEETEEGQQEENLGYLEGEEEKVRELIPLLRHYKSHEDRVQFFKWVPQYVDDETPSPIPRIERVGVYSLDALPEEVPDGGIEFLDMHNNVECEKHKLKSDKCPMPEGSYKVRDLLYPKFGFFIQKVSDAEFQILTAAEDNRLAYTITSQPIDEKSNPKEAKQTMQAWKISGGGGLDMFAISCTGKEPNKGVLDCEYGLRVWLKEDSMKRNKDPIAFIPLSGSAYLQKEVSQFQVFDRKAKRRLLESRESATPPKPMPSKPPKKKKVEPMQSVKPKKKKEKKANWQTDPPPMQSVKPKKKKKKEANWQTSALQHDESEEMGATAAASSSANVENQLSEREWVTHLPDYGDAIPLVVKHTSPFALVWEPASKGTKGRGEHEVFQGREWAVSQLGGEDLVACRPCHKDGSLLGALAFVTYFLPNGVGLP